MDWLRRNKLGLNLAKCEYMLLGRDEKSAQISEIYNNRTEKDEIKRVN